MKTIEKENFKESIQTAILYFNEAACQLIDTRDIISEEIQQLFIGCLLTHKKSPSQEMIELGEDKRYLQELVDQMSTYIGHLNNIAKKYE